MFQSENVHKDSMHVPCGTHASCDWMGVWISLLTVTNPSIRNAYKDQKILFLQKVLPDQII